MKRTLSLVACLLFSLPLFAQNNGAALPALPPSFFTATGIPATGAKLCTTASGTSNNLATFSDAALTTALPNPITLSAGGIPQTSGSVLTHVFIQAKAYRVTLYLAGTGNTCNGVAVGTQIWQFDNIYDFAQLGVFISINNRQFCVTGANFGAKFTAAAALLPSTGGIVDCSNLQGAQAVTSDVFTGVTKPIRLLWPSGTVSVAASITSPSNIEIDFEKAGVLSQAGATTATISGTVHCGPNQQCFTGSGNVVFGANSQGPIYPEWFGAVGNGSILPAPWGTGTDDEAAFLKLLIATSNGGHRVVTQPGKTYKIGPASAQSDTLDLRADNMVYDFGTSTFLANVFIANLSNLSDNVDNVVVNGGIYQPIGDNLAPTIPPATGRYTVGNNCMGVLHGSNIVINGPRCKVMKRVGGITIQTSTAYGASLNIQNVQVNSPIVEGDANPIGGTLTCPYGIEINAATNDNMIRNVHVNDPIVRNCYQAVIASSSAVSLVYDDISVTNLTAENISDIGWNIVGIRNGIFSGTINGVGWQGVRSSGNSFCTFDLVIRGASTLAVPSGQTGTIAGLLTMDATYANSGPNTFTRLDIQGYSAGVSFGTAIVIDSVNDRFPFVSITNASVGVSYDPTSVSKKAVIDTLVLNAVTTPLSSVAPGVLNDKKLFIGQMIDASGTTPVRTLYRPDTANSTATYTADSSNGLTIAVGAGTSTAFVFTSADTFSGFLIACETSTNVCAVFITYSPNVSVKLGGSATWGASASASTYNLYYNGTPALMVENTAVGARTFRIYAIRMNQGAA